MVSASRGAAALVNAVTRARASGPSGAPATADSQAASAFVRLGESPKTRDGKRLFPKISRDLPFVLCNVAVSGLDSDFGTVPTYSRRSRGSSEHSPSSQSLDARLAHSQKSKSVNGVINRLLLS